ncbi:MAG: hypothetical protein OHK0039_49200 [Bacteroidia bacterium]
MADLILTPDQTTTLRSFRRRLYAMMALSSGLDIALFMAEAPLLLPFFGSSLIVDEVIEWFISSMLARNRMDLHLRYKVVGLVPVPGFTSLTLQALLELRRSHRRPQEVLARLAGDQIPA